MIKMVTVRNRWGGFEIRKSTTMENNSHWKGGRSICPDGRVKIKLPTHPCAMLSGYVYRYRLIMENHLGRYLKPDEVIHHRNGDPSDDRLENLELTNAKEHRSNHILDEISKEGAYNAHIEKKCRICGKVKPRDGFSRDDKLNPFSRGSACKPCAALLQKKRRWKLINTKEGEDGNDGN